jgi:hypothetical protein
MAQRLPVVGGDDNTWGSVLNSFLAVTLFNNTNNQSDPNNGTLNTGVVADAQIATGAAINPAKISGTAEVQTNKGVASGYASLSSAGLVPTTQLATGTAGSSNYLRGDGTWVVPPIASNATTSAAGVVQLAGDLGGTSSSATAPTLAATANVEGIISANTTVTGALQKANNLSDVVDPGSSRAALRIPVLTPAAAVAVTNIAGTYSSANPATFTPSSATSVDGYTFAATDLILLTGQTSSVQNGLWQIPATGSAWTRPTEFSTGATIKGRTCTILNGTAYASTSWVLVAATSGVVIDTGNQVWTFANLTYNTSHYSPVGAVNRYAGSTTNAARIPFVNVDDFGADPTGAADSTAAYNTALLALPTVNGALAGEIRFGIGTYKMGAVATSTIGAQVRVRGAGRYATFISYTGSGNCFRLQNPSDPRVTNGSTGGWNSIIQWGGGFGGFTIDGTSASAGAIGIQYGDNEGGLIEDIAIQHFNLTGSIGLLLNNNVWWTEKLRAKAQLLDNTVNCQMQVSVTPNGVPNAPGVSYGYNDIDLEIFANPGQDGVFVSTGANYYNGWLKIRGNFTPATTAAGTYKLGTSTISAMLRIGGTNPNGSGGSTITNSRLDLQAEVANTGGTYAPYGIYFGASGGTNSILNSSGIISLGVNQGFKICNYNIANNASIFTFSGVVTGDTNLNAGTGLCVIGASALSQSQITVAGSTYTLKVGYGDVFDLALTQATTISLTNGGVGPCKKILRTTQGAGGPWTITWPRTTAYASATITNTRVNFAGGSTVNATQTAGAVDIWYLSTIDGANWFCSPFLAQG